MACNEDIPQGYEAHVIESVRVDGDDIVVVYSGRIFAGIQREVLPPGVEPQIVPGARIVLLYHQTPDGQRGPVAHVLLRDVRTGGWAELYEDWTNE